MVNIRAAIVGIVLATLLGVLPASAAVTDTHRVIVQTVLANLGVEASPELIDQILADLDPALYDASLVAAVDAAIANGDDVAALITGAAAQNFATQTDLWSKFGDEWVATASTNDDDDDDDDSADDDSDDTDSGSSTNGGDSTDSDSDDSDSGTDDASDSDSDDDSSDDSDDESDDDSDESDDDEDEEDD